MKINENWYKHIMESEKIRVLQVGKELFLWFTYEKDWIFPFCKEWAEGWEFELSFGDYCSLLVHLLCNLPFALSSVLSIEMKNENKLKIQTLKRFIEFESKCNHRWRGEMQGGCLWKCQRVHPNPQLPQGRSWLWIFAFIGGRKASVTSETT